MKGKKMNIMFRHLTLAAVIGAVTLACSCNNEKYHQEVLKHMDKQMEEQKGFVKSVEEVKSTTDGVVEREAEDRTRIAALETKVSELEATATTLKATSADLAKQLGTPKNVTAEGAADNCIALTVLTNPKIRALACPLMAEVGGDKVEKRLIALISDDKDTSVKEAALKALVSMGSKQTAAVLNATLPTVSGSSARSVAYFMITHNNAASREPALATLKRLSGSSDYNDRYARQNIYQVLAKVGTVNDFATIEAQFAKETDSSTKSQALLALVALGTNQKDKIISLVSKNAELMRSNSLILKALIPYADYRLTESMIAFAPKMSWSSRREAYKILGATQDPVSAKFLVERYNGKESDNDCKRALETIFAKNYPGVVWDAGKKKASLLAGPELEKLIAARNAKMSGAKKTPTQP